MQKLRVSRRMTLLVVGVALIPILGDVVILCDIFINGAPGKAYIESIGLGVLGTIMLLIVAFMWSPQRPMTMMAFVIGQFAVSGSTVALFVVGHYWLALGAFCLGVAVAIVIRIRLHRIARNQRTPMVVDASPYLALIPMLKQLRQHSLWSNYDPEADTLAIHFNEPDAPNVATDSDMTDDDIIVRYDDAGEIIGLTILHASARRYPNP